MFNQKEYNKKYRLENPEKIKQIQSDYYYKHREDRIKNAQNWVKNNQEKAFATRREYRKTKKWKLSSIKNSAKNRKIDYQLSDDEAIKLISSNCYYCGTKDNISIDRIDSNIGYEIDNCVPCCPMCNYMKRLYGKEEFINQCKKIASNHL